MSSPIEKIQKRIESHRSWLLRQNEGKCFDEQLHTTEGTTERIYWHYGYMVALKDVLKLLAKNN